MSVVLPEKNYRQRRCNGFIGIVFVIFMLTMATVFVFGMQKNPDEFSQIPMPALFLIFVCWLGFTSLGVWMVLGYFRERLVLTETTITKYDVFGKKEIPVSEITRLIWFSTFSGITVESTVDKLNISIDNFKKSEQTEIITFLRNSVDVELHSKWFMFYECYRRVIDPQARAIRDDLIFSLVVVALAGVFGFLWWSNWGANYLLMSFISVFCAFRFYRGH